MPVSVEARGVQVSDRLSDLIISAAHIPEGLDVAEFYSFVARTLEVSPTMVIAPQDLLEARRFMEPSWEWHWDGEVSALAERALQAIALGNFLPSSHNDWLPPFPMLEELMMRRRRFPRDARLRLGIDVASRLDWGPLASSSSGERDDANALAADLEALFAFEVGIGQSPPVKPYTIRELVRNTRALALVPAAAGSIAAATHISLGNWAAALMCGLTGGGTAIVFGSSLWLMDKLFKGVKHLEVVPRRRELPAGKPRRKRDPESGGAPSDPVTNE